MYAINVDGFPEQYKEGVYWPYTAIAENAEKITPEVMIGVEKLIKTAEHHSITRMRIQVRHHKTDEGYPVPFSGFDLLYSKV